METYSINEVDVESWINSNIANYLYEGNGEFLKPATKRTSEVWSKCLDYLIQEQKQGGVLCADGKTVSNMLSFEPSEIVPGKDIIKGIQATAPYMRTCKPKGGIRVVKSALASAGVEIDPLMEEIYTKHRKTHNQGVFDVYTPEMRAARSAHLLTGLPDAYGRGRIIGDYRRVALYGVDRLIKKKEEDLFHLGGMMTNEKIQLREEISEQIRALVELKEMAFKHGFDISKEARDAFEAIQWTYFAFLGCVKEEDGAAMSFGRIDSFFDIYIENDIKFGKISEEDAQELIDDFVIKLRIVRHLRTPDFDKLFSGNPTWITVSLGGFSEYLNKPLVTRTSFRILQTLYNMGPAPEPNITVLWSEKLPAHFKEFCTKVSIDTSSIQYENDDLMRPFMGSDYAIACCVSAMKVGKDMQFFGARCNLPKFLLYCINEGKDEITGKQVIPKGIIHSLGDPNGKLDYEAVKKNFFDGMDYLANLYANTMSCIHFMHDKYAYERLQMALLDTDVNRTMAYGIAGISVAADSLSAIKYATVYPIRDDRGIATDFRIEGDYPKFGNDNDLVDSIASEVASTFMEKLRKIPVYRNATPTMSILTITSNVVYGKATGATPDGRKQGVPFAPGANPMHGRDASGALASLNSVAKLNYADCRDGVSNTFSIVPRALGKTETMQINNLISLLDGYFNKSAQHLNVNVLNRDKLLEAMDHPERYPTLTIRVSGYSVWFGALTREQQLDVITRTFHERM